MTDLFRQYHKEKLSSMKEHTIMQKQFSECETKQKQLSEDVHEQN